MTSLRPVALLLIALSLALVGCQSGPVPAAEFVAQADRLHGEALASTVTPDSDLTAYFDELGKRILEGAAAASGGQFRDPVFANMRFHLVGGDVPNAVTTGGRHVYVSAALFQLCRSEEELAAVLAQQFAHAVDLDVQRTGMRPLPAATLDRVAYLYASSPFTAAVDQEADARAFDFYARGGWDPAKFADLYRRLSDAPALAAAVGGRGPTGVPGLPLSARATAAASPSRALPAAARGWRQATVADPQTFNDLRARAAALPGERAAPQNRAWLFLRAFPSTILPSDLPTQKAAQEQLRRDITPTVTPTPIEPN